MCLKLFAPAKLNFGLRIVGRRSDGLHLLESLFWPIDFGDELQVAESDQNSLECAWEKNSVRTSPLPRTEDNLVFRILEEISRLTGSHHEVKLVKRVPTGAGLGGGSADAGALLRLFLKRRPDLRVDFESLANRLGSDIAFFLDPRPSWVTGKGDAIFPLDNRLRSPGSYALHLVFPPFALSTQEVFTEFKNLAKGFSPPDAKGTQVLRNHTSFLTYLRGCVNDLETIAAKNFPLIPRIIQELRSVNPLYAGMTGSGSTCFAIFASPEDRERKTKALDRFCREENCKSVNAALYASP